MAESRFYYPIKVHQGASSASIDTPFVCAIPLNQGLRGSAIILSTDEGTAQQGLYVWDDRRWRFALPQLNISVGVIDGYTIDVYWDQNGPVTPLPEGAVVFRNGVRSPTQLVEGEPGVVYTVMVPVSGSGDGTVKSVNNVLPDSNGNVTLEASDVGAVDESVVGQPGGVASLDSSGWVPMDQLPPGIIGGMQYQGPYNADTDVPELPDADPSNKGFYWVVSVAGVQQGLDLNVGDWVVSNGTSYDKIDNQEGRVLSVNGALPDPVTGDVVVPFATTTQAGTVYVPTDGDLIIGPDGALSVNTSAIGAWTPSNTIWVDYNGSASEGTGKQNNPYRTIGQAIDNAHPTEMTVIMVSPGSFDENVLLGSKPIYLRGWGNVGNYPRTQITGTLTCGGPQPIRIQNFGVNYTGTQPAFSVTNVGSTQGYKFDNVSVFAINTQTALLTNAASGTWTGSAEFTSFYVSGGKIDHATGTGSVSVQMFPSQSTSALEVHAGTVVYDEVQHFNSVLHTAGSLDLRNVRALGTSSGVAAIISSADDSVGNFLSLTNVSTWVTPSTQSYVSKTGLCSYIVSNLTRNLISDTWSGNEVLFKYGQDTDTIVSRDGVNYTGSAGEDLNAHIEGIDDALGIRLTSVSSVGSGASVVANGTAGTLKSVVSGAGISITNDATSVTIANTGVLALSTVSGTGVTSLVNTTSGQLKSVRGAGGMTISESAGVITFTSSQESTGVTSLNDITGPVSVAAASGTPIQVTTLGSIVSIGYNGIRSLNGITGQAVLLQGSGIRIAPTSPNIAITNTGIHSITAEGTTFVEGGVSLVAGTNVTFDVDPTERSITVNSTGGGGTGGVSSVNTLQGALTIVGGSGVSVNSSGSTITLSATGAANPVASLNTLSGNLNLAGSGGISIAAQGADTLLISYDGGASVAVTELNGQTGALEIAAGTGISIDDSVPGVFTLNVAQGGIQQVSNPPDSDPDAQSLVLDNGTTDGTAVIATLLGSSSVQLIPVTGGYQLVAPGSAGTVTAINGITPDPDGDVELTAEDLGALKADGTIPFTDNQDAAGFTLDNLADPVEAQQPVTLNYVSTLIIDQGTF